jgi:hypothetical protein
MDVSAAGSKTGTAQSALLHTVEVQRRRRERVLMFLLVELLTILTFIAMGFAFVTQNELNIGRNYRDELAALEERHREVLAENRRLTEELEAVRRQLQQIIQALSIQRVIANPEEFERWLEEQRQRTLQALPVCENPAGPLLAFEFLPNGDFRAVRAAATGEGAPDVGPILSQGAMSRSTLGEFARPLSDFGRDQRNPCRYRATAVARHENLRLYLRQMTTLRGYFYVRELGVAADMPVAPPVDAVAPSP